MELENDYNWRTRTDPPGTPNPYIGGEEFDEIVTGGRILGNACHNLASRCGWWTDLATGASVISGADESPKINVAEKLCLIHSEISEGMEGYRKSLMDDKLPHRSMLEVELADAVIRCFDLAGGIGLDLPGAIAEKLQYNANRADHKLSNRRAKNGKKF